ncbi:putative CoA ligase CCL7 [Salvia divinorum]|uniref:CoA ligase CCL7 n=1 Tax=Salvia divinorum TaxID=28513 RepID=A0ABD1H5J8_SALDI
MIPFLFRKLPSNSDFPALIDAESAQTLTSSDLCLKALRRPTQPQRLQRRRRPHLISQLHPLPGRLPSGGGRRRRRHHRQPAIHKSRALQTDQRQQSETDRHGPQAP